MDTFLLGRVSPFVLAWLLPLPSATLLTAGETSYLRSGALILNLSVLLNLSELFLVSALFWPIFPNFLADLSTGSLGLFFFACSILLRSSVPTDGSFLVEGVGILELLSSTFLSFNSSITFSYSLSSPLSRSFSLCVSKISFLVSLFILI